MNRVTLGAAVASISLMCVVQGASDTKCERVNTCDYESMSPRITITSAGILGARCTAGDAGPAVDACLDAPTSVSIDPKLRRVYIADTGNHAARVVDLNTLAMTTIAGVLASPGVQGWHRVPSHQPELQGPQDVVLDPTGRILYIADTEHHVIRSLNLDPDPEDVAAGRREPLHIIAGVLGSAGYAGDGGLATAAQLQRPHGVALDGLEPHLLYVSDTGNHVVRLVDLSTGLLSTVAGVLGYGGPSEDEGLATDATLNFPHGIAVDAAARELYVAEPFNHVVRVVDLATGGIATVAGILRSPGAAGDGGPSAFAQLNYPYGLAVDPIARQLYVADAGNHAVRLVGPLADRSSRSEPLASTTFTIAGVLGVSGDDATGAASTSAQLRFPTGLTLDLPARLLYVADKLNQVVRRVDLQSRAMSTVIGTLGAHGREGEGEGVAIRAQLQRPLGVASSQGHVFVADTSGHAVRSVDLWTGEVATLAGVLRAASCERGPVTTSTTNESAMDTDFRQDNQSQTPPGWEYFAYSRYDNQICNSTPYTLDLRSRCNGWYGLTAIKCQEKCTSDAVAPYCPRRTCVAAGFEPSTGWCHLFEECEALRSAPSAALFQKIPPASLLTFPTALAAHTQTTDLYIADAGAHAVYRVNTSQGGLELLAGQPCLPGVGAMDSNSTESVLRSPSGVTLDEAAQELYIADTGNHVVRKLNFATGVLSVVIGVLGEPGCSLVPTLPLETRLRNPRGLALDSVTRRLFVADTGNHVVRVFDLKALHGESRAVTEDGTSKVSILAGVPGVLGQSGDGGPAYSAQLNFPYGLAAEEPTAWHLALSIAGDLETWAYESEIWKTCGAFANGSDVKSSAYCAPFDRFRLVFRHADGEESNVEFIGDGGASLRDMLSGRSLNTRFGSAVWQRLSAGAALQGDCVTEGFMVSTPTTSATTLPTSSTSPVTIDATMRCRLGALLSQNNDCLYPNAFIGLGCASSLNSSNSSFLGFSAGMGDIGESRAWSVNAEVWIKSAIGAVYIADNQNHAVRRVDRTTGLLSTAAGVLGVMGHAGDGGRATSAELYAPTDVSVDAVARRLYVADASNHAVRVVAVTGDVRIPANQMTTLRADLSGLGINMSLA